jgi:SAM-dependent methyltransferase
MNGAFERDLNAYLESYETLPFESHQEFFRRNALLKLLTSNEFGVATEIGCGRSSIFESWSPNLKSQTVEPIGLLLDGAKARLQCPEIWTGYCARAEDVSSTNTLAKSDITILSSILHEVEDPAELLNAAIGLTKPGGILAIIVTNKDSIHRILGVHLGFQAHLNQKTSTETRMQQTHGAYSISELTEELQGHGLEVIKTETFFPKLFAHKQMQEFLDDSLISFDFLKSMEALSDSLPGLGSEILAVSRVPIG